MKALTGWFVVAAVGLVGAARADAQFVDSGSTGADGAFRATLATLGSRTPAGTTVQCSGSPPTGCTFTVPLREPPNHVFHFTTVDIDPNVTVRFVRNAANTPVFILASGDVTVLGLIDVSGEDGRPGVQAAKGGPGGFDGGLAGDLAGGAGGGPGGGEGGALPGRYPRAGCYAACYGNPEIQPMIGGSGGGGAVRGLGGLGNGGGGGGALLIASSGTIDLGQSNPFSPERYAIWALGGSPEGGRNSLEGRGSGGTVRLVGSIIRGARGILAGWIIHTAVSGRIRLEAPLMQYDVSQADPTPSVAPPWSPIVIFPPVTPALRIASISGVPLPPVPTVEAATPDVTIDPTSLPGGDSVVVVVEATHVPADTPVRVIVSPQYGAGDRTISNPTPLTGLAPCMTMPGQQCRQASVTVAIAPTGVGVISAVISDPVTPVP